MITYKYSKVHFQRRVGMASVQVSVSRMTWVLATVLRSSARAVPILTCQAHHNHSVSLELLPRAFLYRRLTGSRLVRLQNTCLLSQLPVPCPPLTHGISVEAVLVLESRSSRGHKMVV